MADHRAIWAVCEAVLQVLRSSHQAEGSGNEMEFKIYLAKDFSTPMNAGVSLFLYRIFPNDSHRTPGGRIRSDGQRYQPQLPLDLHFLLTAWGKEASLQLTIAGWMMRVLEDTPILPAGLLNTVAPGIFEPEETAVISLAELRTEDLLRMWDTLVQNVYQLSVPYVARNVRIESKQMLAMAQLVQERDFDYRGLGQEAASP